MHIGNLLSVGSWDSFEKWNLRYLECKITIANSYKWLMIVFQQVY